MNKWFKEYDTDASYLMVFDYSITFNWLDFLETFVKNVFKIFFAFTPVWPAGFNSVFWTL